MKGNITMKLCKELQEIYKSELTRGNYIASMMNHKKTESAPATMVVTMKRVLDDYKIKTVEQRVYYGTFNPSTKSYFCPDCGMMIEGPLSYGQNILWPVDRGEAPHPSVIATPENVYWLDESWYYDGAVPTLMDSFDGEDKPEVEKC